MKKIFYSLLALAAISSCAKTEAVYTEDNSEIKIKPATALATKANQLAAIDGTEYPVAENFDVYGYWANLPAGSSFTNEDAEVTTYLGDGGAVEFTNKGNYWGGTTTYYWPKNGSLRFAAYSPSSVDMDHDLASDTYTVKKYYQPSATAETWDLLIAPTSQSYTAMTAAENVSVVFEHALSWITVKVVAKDAEAAKAFDLKKVTINNVVTTADLAAVMSGADKAINWTLSETVAPVVVFEGSQAVTAEPTVIETTTNGTIVIPQPTTTITVDYTQNALEGTPALDNQSVTVDLVLDKDNTPWEPGKHYVYTIVFGLDEILINPDVVDWEDVEVGEIEADATNVSTLDQLKAALAKGGKIALQNNIEASEILTMSADAVLDGNGYTLTSTAGRAINVSGATNATIKNLTIEAAGERAINVIQGTKSVVVDNVIATSANYTVNIAGSAAGAKVTIANSELTGLNVVNVAAADAVVEVVKTKITCDDKTDVEGYAALAINPDATNAKVTATECEIILNDDDCHAGSQNAEGSSVVLVDCTGATNIKTAHYIIRYGDYSYTFTTFEKVLTKVQKGETIILLRNTTEKIIVPAGSDFTIDLNGFSLSAESAEMAHNSMVKVESGASLKIVDSKGNGKISYTYNGEGDPAFGWGSYTIENRGNLIVESGKIEIVCALNEVSANHMYCAIHQASGSTVINGGTISNANYRSVRINNGTLTFNGGVMEGQVWMHPFAENTSITINGGEFAPRGVDGSSVYVENGAKTVNMNVTAGTFETKIGCANPAKAGVTGTVKGGNFGSIDARLIAEGYEAVEEGGRFTVKQK